jgi:hypothetical protein
MRGHSAHIISGAGSAGRAVTDLGGGSVLGPVGVGLVLWLLWQRRPMDAVVVAVALAAASRRRY